MSKENSVVRVSDKNFKHYLTAQQIEQSLAVLAARINIDYAEKKPVFLVILNGAFMFASDLMKKIDIQCEISFLRVSSYEGMESTQQVKEILGIDEYIKGRHIVLVEDIIDTGITMEHIISKVTQHGALSIRIATLLFKKGKFEKNYPIDYIGFTIPNDFVVGYGLDYNGFGRNLKDIYSVIEE